MVSIEIDVNLSGLSCVNSKLQQERSWLLPLIRRSVFLWLAEGHRTAVCTPLLQLPSRVYTEKKSWFTPQNGQSQLEQKMSLTTLAVFFSKKFDPDKALNTA